MKLRTTISSKIRFHLPTQQTLFGDMGHSSASVALIRTRSKIDEINSLSKSDFQVETLWGRGQNRCLLVLNGTKTLRQWQGLSLRTPGAVHQCAKIDPINNGWRHCFRQEIIKSLTSWNCQFDYRIVRRGLAKNLAEQRPVLVMTVSRERFKVNYPHLILHAQDTLNFPKRSVF